MKSGGKFSNNRQQLALKQTSYRQTSFDNANNSFFSSDATKTRSLHGNSDATKTRSLHGNDDKRSFSSSVERTLTEFPKQVTSTLEQLKSRHTISKFFPHPHPSLVKVLKPVAENFVEAVRVKANIPNLEKDYDFFHISSPAILEKNSKVKGVYTTNLMYCVVVAIITKDKTFFVHYEGGHTPEVKTENEQDLKKCILDAIKATGKNVNEISSKDLKIKIFQNQTPDRPSSESSLMNAMRGSTGDNIITIITNALGENVFKKGILEETPISPIYTTAATFNREGKCTPLSWLQQVASTLPVFPDKPKINEGKQGKGLQREGEKANTGFCTLL